MQGVSGGVCCYLGPAVGWPRSVSLLSRFCCLSWRKEVVASYLALSAVLRGRVRLLHLHRGVLCFVWFSAV